MDTRISANPVRPIQSYEDAARTVRDLFGAAGVVLIVIDGAHGSGSSVAATSDLLEDKELVAHFVLEFLAKGLERITPVDDDARVS